MMEGCSSMAQWSNMYQHHHHHQHQQVLKTAGSIPLMLDPIHEELHHGEEDQGQGIILSNSTGEGIQWGEGAPRDQMCSSTLPMIMSPLSGLIPFDASNDNNNNNNKGMITVTSSSPNSIDHQQSLECLLSGTNSNTDTTSVEDDDGISMLFSDCRNFLNFSTNNNPPTNNDANTKKRSIPTINGDNNQDYCPPFSITSSSSNLRGNKRQRNHNVGEKGMPGRLTSSSNISFQQGSSSGSSIEEPDAEAIQQMKEMIYRAAAFRPVNFGVEMVEKPKRKNVRISSDPQTVAARQRRERISERLRVLQKLVPGGSKMDTASMLDEAANYLKFLRNQVKALEAFGDKSNNNKLVDHPFQFSPNSSTNHLFPPINLQFSSMAFPMQASNIIPNQFSLQNPNANNHVLHAHQS